MHHLGVEISRILKDAGLECCFDSFGAPISSPLQSDEYFRSAHGCYPSHLAKGALNRGPRLEDVTALQFAFKLLEKTRSRLSLVDCLITSSRSNMSTGWTVGHFVVFRGMTQNAIYHVGCPRSKLIFLIVDDMYGQPYFWLIGTSAYDAPLVVGQSVPKIAVLRGKPLRSIMLVTLSTELGNGQPTLLSFLVSKMLPF